MGHSCAFHGGMMTGNAALTDANFKVAGFASGTAQTIHVFGIGGIGKDGIVLEAKRNMYNAYPLEKGQAYANISVDFKRGFYLVFAKTTCTISADIIDFNSQSSSEKNEDANAIVTADIIDQLKSFNVGEKVFFSPNSTTPVVDATIAAFVNGRAKVRFLKSSGAMAHKSVNLMDLYKTANDSDLLNIDPIYQIGDSVYFTSSKSLEKVRGQIFALGYKGACIVFEEDHQKGVEIVNRIDFRTMKTFIMEQNKNDMNGEWELTTLNGKPVINDSKIPTFIVNAHDLSVGGFGGCNRYFGSFKVEKNKVTLSTLGSTRMACTDKNIENEFMRALGDQSFEINRTTASLTLKNDTNKLVFRLVDE